MYRLRFLPSAFFVAGIMTAPPIVVGIIGGVASGKSQVANQLVQRGAARIDADALGHALLNENGSIRSEVVELLGPKVLDSSNKIDRKKIAALVFGNDQASRKRLADLEAILHPAIRLAAEALLLKLRKQPKLRMIVLDAPLLVEADWVSLCDEVLFVDTPLAIRQRLASQRGWSVDELGRREAAQLSLAEKRAAATKILVNDGTVEQLQMSVDKWHDEVMKYRTDRL